VNAAKHAPLQPVDIGLHYGEDGVQMITSNPLPPGRHGGPSPGPEFTTVNGGYGLRGMRERLLLISGSLTAASGDGRWTVTAQVPR
jgi:signal transduction histidine kinase